VRFDETEPFVDAAGNLGENVCGIHVTQLVGFVDRLPGQFAKGCRGRREGCDMIVAIRYVDRTNLAAYSFPLSISTILSGGS
jgi:hypothetical protein